jgi:quinol monooxygenase YgiN
MRSLVFLLQLAVLSLGLTPSARADDANPAYIVTYIETSPAAKAKALAMLKDLAKASRKEEGSLRFELLQRIGQDNHFAILEAWKDKEAQAAHARTDRVKALRDKLAPMLRAPYDERPHTGLAVGATKKAGEHAIYTVTHVDIIPPKKDEGIASVKELAETGRKAKGNLRFDALQQSSRPNHMTVTEIWSDMATYDAHGMMVPTKAFRDNLLPMSGSLYDERLYRRVN